MHHANLLILPGGKRWILLFGHLQLRRLIFSRGLLMKPLVASKFEQHCRSREHPGLQSHWLGGSSRVHFSFSDSVLRLRMQGDTSCWTWSWALKMDPFVTGSPVVVHLLPLPVTLKFWSLKRMIPHCPEKYFEEMAQGTRSPCLPDPGGLGSHQVGIYGPKFWKSEESGISKILVYCGSIADSWFSTFFAFLLKFTEALISCLIKGGLGHP